MSYILFAPCLLIFSGEILKRKEPKIPSKPVNKLDFMLMYCTYSCTDKGLFFY